MGCCGGGRGFKPDNKVKNSNVETQEEESGSLISIMMIILVLIAVALLANKFFI